MAVAKVTEITSTSPKSFDDAVANGIARATMNCRPTQTFLPLREKVARCVSIVPDEGSFPLTLALSHEGRGK
jgi:hypothetical protein